MNNLKTAIADKVLEVSSSGADDIKIKLEKINRFRDFSDACKTLIQKYPTIEPELMRMVDNNDFDTRIASSRVDTIIRLAESGTTSNRSQNSVMNDISELHNITEQIPTTDNDVDRKTDEVSETTIPVFENRTESTHYLPEDIEYVEVKPLAIEGPSFNENKSCNQYIEFEDIGKDAEPKQTIVSSTANVDQNTSIYREPDIQEKRDIHYQSSATKENAKKGFQVVIAIAAIVTLIFAIVFIIRNLQTILWVLGIAIVVGGAVFILFKKNKNKGVE
ncbi:MAG: hypothetical protein RL662_1100 [Bacteroidota bacterium]|jgi:tetrahydromethanopterin S-methyltransferase subunit B